MLQEFLGTANYARPHAGPFYAKAAHPLRPLLGNEPRFPMTAEQEAAVQALKDLMNEQHPLFLRGLAWVKLLKVWAALRFDDLKGLLPREVRGVLWVPQSFVGTRLFNMG